MTFFLSREQSSIRGSAMWRKASSRILSLNLVNLHWRYWDSYLMVFLFFFMYKSTRRSRRVQLKWYHWDFVRLFFWIIGAAVGLLHRYDYQLWMTDKEVVCFILLLEWDEKRLTGVTDEKVNRGRVIENISRARALTTPGFSERCNVLTRSDVSSTSRQRRIS